MNISTLPARLLKDSDWLDGVAEGGDDARIVALLREAAHAIGDLQAAKVLELSDAQVVALLGGPDAAEEAASHAGYIARVAMREASAVGKLRAIQQCASLGLTDTGCVETDLEHALFTEIHRLAVTAMAALRPAPDASADECLSQAQGTEDKDG